MGRARGVPRDQEGRADGPKAWLPWVLIFAMRVKICMESGGGRLASGAGGEFQVPRQSWTLGGLEAEVCFLV